MKRIITLLSAIFSFIMLSAQQSAMEEFMYSSGKINVVIAIVLVIFLLIFLYLFRMDKRVKQLEKED